MHIFFEAKKDAEQRYVIKYLFRKKKTRQETLCEIEEVYGPAALQNGGKHVVQAIFRRL